MNTRAELQAATGQELRGLNAPPGFREAAGGDYTLASINDLIDAGLATPGINGDFQEAGPDMGAFEFAPSLVLYGAPRDWSIDYSGPPGTRFHLSRISGRRPGRMR